MLRVVGIVALIVLATACGQTATTTLPSPSPVIAQGNWSQNLAFTGELHGQMTGIVVDTPTQQSFCSGLKAHIGDVWADNFYGTIDTSGQQWQLTFLIGNFRGAGSYGRADVDVQMRTADKTRAWLAQGGDKVAFTVDRGQQSGTVDATLTDATTGKVGAEHITGNWNCRG